ncbi:MAG: 4Fe-4S dicluster domain-containing protein [Proteobacteria bacterium]|nr:4Fe-4S dicluster domain-containing protein [Pseudomonadota bacterium]
MQVNNDIIGIESGFARQVALDSGVDLFACYQCEKCTNGCPVTFAMDYEPHQIIRMVQLGLREEIARASTIWVCASCETCFTRCPQGVDIPKLMDYLKQLVLSQGDKPAEGAVAAFHQVFLENIRRFGRVNEAFLMGAYQLKSAKAEKRIDVKEMISNLKLGIEMLKRGRLGFIPKKTGAKEAVRKLFEK